MKAKRANVKYVSFCHALFHLGYHQRVPPTSRGGSVHINQGKEISSGEAPRSDDSNCAKLTSSQPPQRLLKLFSIYCRLGCYGADMVGAAEVQEKEM